MTDDPDNVKPDEGLSSFNWERHFIVFKHSTVWQPATDAYETPDRFTIIVELAGMRENDLSVNLVNRRLIISGKRPRPVHDGAIAYHQMEVQYGEFRTEVLIPWEVEREQVKASYEDGFLRIELPRRQRVHAIRVVEVNDSNE